MKALILLSLMLFVMLSCKKENVDNLYPEENTEIIIQDSTVMGTQEVSPDSLDQTPTVDTTDYDVDSITNNGNKP